MNIFRDQNPLDSLRFEIDKVGRSYKVSRNFTLGELASKDGANIVLLHPALIIALQTIRDHVGKPIRVNSAFRSPAHNKAIGGASNSLHTLGLAADIVIDGMTPIEVASLASDMGLGGIKAYPTFTHIDVGRHRTW
jgi:zinc D-Ala-D-Ala carboxypeptidase